MGRADSTRPLGPAPPPGAPARNQAVRGCSQPERVSTRWVGASRRRACGWQGRGNEPIPARLAPPPPPSRLTWAQPHLLCGRGLFGGVFGRAWQSPAEPGGALERAGGPSFQGFLGLPRSRPPRSRPGARRPPPACACGCEEGAVGAGVRARTRLCVGAPPQCAPRALRSRLCRCPQGLGWSQAGSPRAAPR